MSDTTPEIASFIAAYSGDATAIAFAWNGKHGDGFEDASEAFRNAVVDRVLAAPDAAPGALVADLYRAMTDYSAQAWCIDERAGGIATLLLTTGRGEITHEFIRGACRSYDAHSATLVAGLPRGCDRGMPGRHQLNAQIRDGR